ncbi:hypothetical protein HDU96_001516, partial [Phlyctochytrium bullatum]
INDACNELGIVYGDGDGNGQHSSFKDGDRSSESEDGEVSESSDGELPVEARDPAIPASFAVVSPRVRRAAAPIRRQVGNIIVGPRFTNPRRPWIGGKNSGITVEKDASGELPQEVLAFLRTYSVKHKIDVSLLLHGVDLLPKFKLTRSGAQAYLSIEMAELGDGKQALHLTQKTQSESCLNTVYFKAWGQLAKRTHQISCNKPLEEVLLLCDEPATRFYVGQTVSAYKRMGSKRKKEKDPDLHVCLGHFARQFDRDTAEMAGIALIEFLMARSSLQNASAYGRYVYFRQTNHGQPASKDDFVAMNTYRFFKYRRATFGWTAPPQRFALQAGSSRDQFSANVNVLRESADSRAFAFFQDCVGEVPSYVNQYPCHISTLGEDRCFLNATAEEIHEASQTFHSHPNVTASNVVCLLGYQHDDVLGGMLFEQNFIRKGVGECDVVRQRGDEATFATYLVMPDPGMLVACKKERLAEAELKGLKEQY